LIAQILYELRPTHQKNAQLALFLSGNVYRTHQVLGRRVHAGAVRFKLATMKIRNKFHLATNVIIHVELTMEGGS
jgi:hypothetical protein